MRNTYIALFFLVPSLIILCWQLWLSLSIGRTEQQPYMVLWSKDRLELREYPRSLMATVRSPSALYSDMAYGGFSKLAGYIFGGNSEQQAIAMTAPVHIQLSSAGSSMSFVMPASLNHDSIPDPDDSTVELVLSESRKVLTLRFGGWLSDARRPALEERLLNGARTNGLKAISAPYYLAYNPPFQLFGRRNEIAIQVE